jgi:predicted CopG family antitoxin
MRLEKVDSRSEKSLSEVAMRNPPGKRKLSEILDEIGRDDELADRIEAASQEMRRSKMREHEGVSAGLNTSEDLYYLDENASL